MKIVFIAQIVLLLAIPSHSNGDALDADSLSKSIAEALSYPVGKIAVKDTTADIAKEFGEHALVGLSFASSDDSFAEMGILVSTKGYTLPGELIKSCENQITSGSATIKRFDLKSGIYGYSGLGMAGPGGSGESIIASWPERGIYLQIGLSIPREGLESDESTKTYHDLVMDGGPKLAEKLVKCVERLVEHIERADIREATAPSPAQPSSRPRSTQPLVSKPAGNSVQSNETTDGSAASSTPWSILIVTIVAAMGLAWLLFKKRQ